MMNFSRLIGYCHSDLEMRIYGSILMADRPATTRNRMH
jgi:hypothetical protein